MKYQLEEATICIIGLGYVGQPLAEAFSKSVKVIGFDTDVKLVNKLQKLAGNTGIIFTADAAEIGRADFIIICVPTPLTKSAEPDLSYLRNAAETAGRSMKKGAVVILESTVYPGVTEEILQPILEKESGLRSGLDFKVAYSPERINPGDKAHTVDKIAKVVAGMDEETTELVADLYRRVTPHVFKVKSIKVAEAAKIIENIQRDLNIALMNELAIIFQRIGLRTDEVLDAATTKWNFHRYSPGLVGGHCTPVDPHYLVYKAKELGYHPQVILAGRAVNDYMPKYTAEMTIKALNEAGKIIKGSRVLVLGLTYKEDVPDIRKSPVKELTKELEEYGVEVIGFDPQLNVADLKKEFKIRLLSSTELEEVEKIKADCIILAVAHSSFRKLTLNDLKKMQKSNPILIDVRRIFDGDEARNVGFNYQAL